MSLGFVVPVQEDGNYSVDFFERSQTSEGRDKSRAQQDFLLEKMEKELFQNLENSHSQQSLELFLKQRVRRKRKAEKSIEESVTLNLKRSCSESRSFPAKESTEENELRSRRKFPYHTNVTPSRGNSRYIEGDANFCKVDILQEPASGSYRLSRIRDYAERRVISFFYLALSYHHENCSVSRDQTVDQYGRAICGRCDAGHSCVIPNTADDSYSMVLSSIPFFGVSEASNRKLLAWGFTPEEIDSLELSRDVRAQAERILKEKGASPPTSLISKSSYLYKGHMNGTVEIPTELNQFDSILENNWFRPKAIELLRKVSSGNLSPYAALMLFKNELQRVMLRVLEEIPELLAALNSLEKIEGLCKAQEKRIIECQDDRELNLLLSSYAVTLLKLKEKHEEIQEFEYVPNLALTKRVDRYKKKEGWSRARMKSRVGMANWIKRCFENEKERIRKSSREELEEYLNKTLDFLGDRGESYKELREDFFVRQKGMRRSRQFRQLLLETIDHIPREELILFIDYHRNHLLNRLLQGFLRSRLGRFFSLEEEKNFLKRIKIYVEQERRGFLLPEFRMLVGRRLKNGVRVPLNRRELIDQKFALRAPIRDLI